MLLILPRLCAKSRITPEKRALLQVSDARDPAGDLTPGRHMGTYPISTSKMAILRELTPGMG